LLAKLPNCTAQPRRTGALDAASLGAALCTPGKADLGEEVVLSSGGVGSCALKVVTVGGPDGARLDPDALDSGGLAAPLSAVAPSGADAAESLADAALAAVALAGVWPADVAALFAAFGSGVALLVARFTEILRVELGRPAASGGTGAGFGPELGPDSNSGTIRTMSATKIVAPIRRSLTRRSMRDLTVLIYSGGF
jgi:hypothetical protein